MAHAAACCALKSLVGRALSVLGDFRRVLLPLALRGSHLSAAFRGMRRTGNTRRGDGGMLRGDITRMRGWASVAVTPLCRDWHLKKEIRHVPTILETPTLTFPRISFTRHDECEDSYENCDQNRNRWHNVSILHHILGNRVGRKQGTYDPTHIFFPVRLVKAIIFKRPLSDLYPYWWLL